MSFVARRDAAGPSIINERQRVWNGMHAKLGVAFIEKDLPHHIDTVLASNEDLQSATFCPHCFYFLGIEFEVNCGPRCLTLNTIQIQRHAFWTRCVRMIVELATVDISSLRRLLLANREACSSEVHGLPMPDNLAGPILAVLDSLYVIFTAGLTRGMRPLQPRTETFKYFHKRRGYWPVCLEQLFPLGVQCGIDALFFWCCVPIGPAQFSLLTTVMIVARALAMPYLLDSTSRDCLVWCIVRALTTESISWPQKGPYFTAPPGLALPEENRGEPMMVGEVANFLSQLRDHLNARSDDVMRFLRGYETPVLAAAAGITAETSTNIDTGIVRECSHLLRGRPDTTDVAFVVQEFLLRRSISWLCANPRCARSELARTGLCAASSSAATANSCATAAARASAKTGLAALARDTRTSAQFSALLPAADPFVEAEDFKRGFDALGLAHKDVGSLHRWPLPAGGLLAPRGSQVHESQLALAPVLSTCRI